MNIVAIIQARMGSTRLPGKVLMDIAGETVLARVVARVRRMHLVNEVVVATSVSPSDDAIVAECERLRVKCFRGSENDVLDRYHRAAQAAHADVIVRITSDCPLIDPETSDHIVQEFLREHPDYASNTLERTYARGLDTEVITSDALVAAWRDASQPHEREHVTPFLYQHPERFKLLSVRHDQDLSQHRWTLDTPEDLRFIRAIYEKLSAAPDFSWRHVLGVIERQPELAAINRHVRQKALP